MFRFYGPQTLVDDSIFPAKELENFDKLFTLPIILPVGKQ